MKSKQKDRSEQRDANLVDNTVSLRLYIPTRSRNTRDLTCITINKLNRGIFALGSFSRGDSDGRVIYCTRYFIILDYIRSRYISAT